MNVTYPQAVLFDLDDTLVVYDRASDESWAETCGIFFKRSGFGSADELYAAIDGARHTCWGDPEWHRRGRMNLFRARRDVVTLAFRNSGKGPGTDEQAFAIADHYTVLQKTKIRLFPDTLEILDFFAAAKIPMGLLTNGSSAMQWEKIDRFGLRKYFGFCLVEGDLGFGKPDPRVFRRALELLRLPASPGIWMVGDNPAWDIAPARELGLTAVWADRGNHDREEAVRAGADRQIRELRELLQT